MPYLLLKDLPRYDCLLEAAKEFPDLDPTAVEAFLNLLRTGDDAFAVTERHLSEHGITQGRFGVLMQLMRSVDSADGVKSGPCGVGPRTPAELAEAAGVTRATMTGLIDTLERDGLAKRAPDQDDRRMMSVRLTAKGEQLLNRFLPVHFRAIAGLMSTLSQAERKVLVGLLTKIQQQATLTMAQQTATASAAR